MNFPNEKGVGIVYLLMEKPEKRSGGIQDGVSFSFSFENLDIRMKRKEEKEGDVMKIEMNEKSARTTQARRESEGGKLVI